MATVDRASKHSQPATQRQTAAKAAVNAPPAHTALPDQPNLQRAVENPGMASAGDLLGLQRGYGNRAVSHLVNRSARSRPFIQAKLTVGPAGDRYEQEADRVANQVMRAPAGPGFVEPEEAKGSVQRKPLMASISRLVQRHSVPKKILDSDDEKEEEDSDEGPVQRQAARPSAAGFEAAPGLEGRMARSTGQALPGKLRGNMEQRFGADFGGVRVHANRESVQLNRELSAHAFTHGRDIYFGSGQYNPASSKGQHLLAHELTHVVQQGAAGRSTAQRKPALIQRFDIFKPKLWTKKGRKKAQVGSYNILKDQPLPQSEPIAKDHLESLQQDNMTSGRKVSAKVEIKDALRNIDDTTHWLLVSLTAKKKNTALTDEDLVQVRDEIRDQLNVAASVDDAINAAKVVLKVQGDGETDNKRAIARVQAAGVFREKTLDYTRVYLAQSFLKLREGVQMPDAYVPDDQRPGFAAALKKMPTVAFFINPRATGGGFRQNVGWKDGGNLVDKIVPHNDLVGPKKWMGAKRLASRKFRRKVNKVDQMVRIMVEPELLSEIPRPNINMHATAEMGFTTPWGFRASASKGEVNLAYNTATNVVAHEVGHHLENFLPPKRWHDLHMMLGVRHEASGGGGAKSGATPPFTHLSEGRYGGKYVTGKYTSTAYGSGNAEVVSMMMQYFSNPAKTLKLVDGDPQHAAIVLRAFRPTEYKSIGELRQYDKYLPHKKPPGNGG